MNTTTPVKNPSPKVRFLSMPPVRLTDHRNIVSSDQFQTSADHAMLELVAQVIQQTGQANGNPNAALAGFFRIQGAYEFITQMKLLAETPKLPETNNEGQLDHRA
jgi:hypothetical protein